MSLRKPLGEHLDKQREAAKKLQHQGPLTHEELASKIGLQDNRDVMQAVIRGLSDNGLLHSRTDETGQRQYSVDEEIDIETIFDLD